MKCPICDKLITDHQTDYMEHILTEEYITCKDDHHYFHSMYAYGSTQETIGSVTFTHHHADMKEKRDLLHRQFMLVLTLEREAYIRRKAEKRSET